MGEVVGFPVHGRASAGSDESADSGPIQSSAVTAPDVKDFRASIASQSGRTKRRRQRDTLTLLRPTASATASSDNSREAMKSERCMGANVHLTHNAGQGQCTPGVIQTADDSVHAVYMAGTARKVIPREKPRYRQTFIRQWRMYRNLTLEQLAERIETTHASLSRIERGKQPYTQPMLEALADALQTDPASLLMRDPSSPDAIWSLWDNAADGERRAIVELARTVLAIKAKAG